MWIPSELIERDNWVNCFDTKTPFNPRVDTSRHLASTTDPTTWGPFNLAKENIEKHYFTKLGYCFREGDNIVGIDIDDGVDENGLLNEFACDIINACNSFTEFSQNKRGVHIYLKGKLPDGVGGLHNSKRQIEIYQYSRFFVLTGNALKQVELNDNQKAIDYILDKYFKEEMETFNNREYREAYYKPIYNSPDKEKGLINLEPIYPDIYQGTRNNSLLSLGCQLLSENYSEGQIRDKLTEINQTKCHPPLDDDEIERIMRRVKKYEERRIFEKN